MASQRIPGYCPLCISRCGCISVVENGTLRAVESDPNHPTGHALCIKGKMAPSWVHSPARLLYPMQRTKPKGAADPGWQRIGWEQALEQTAARMRKTAESYGAEAVAYAVTTPSGTAIADSMGWIFRLFNAFGSPNAIWTSHVCNWHKDFTSALTSGADLGMPDYAHTGCIVYWGFNPATCWPAQATLATQALQRGAKLIVIDPRQAGLANRANQWLRVKPGTDGALALGIAGILLQEGWFDRDFVAHWSNGPFLVREDTRRFLTHADLHADGSTQQWAVWDEARQDIAWHSRARSNGAGITGKPALSGVYTVSTPTGPVECRPAFEHYKMLCQSYTPQRVAAITGIPAQQIEDTAWLLHSSGPVSYYAWSGVGQHTNASQTARAMNLLFALTGSHDARGGNVHFAKPPLNDISGNALLPATQKLKALGLDSKPLGPPRHGWITEQDFYTAVLTGSPYPVKGLVAFGSNLLQSQPAAARGIQALQALDFYVHADLFLTPMAQHADIVLPVASPWEREGLCAGFQVDQAANNLLQYRQRAIEPLGEARSDTWIAFELARHLGLSAQFFDGDREAGLRHVLAPSGVSLEELHAHPEGVRIENETAYRKYLAQGFATPSGLLEIYAEQLLDIGQTPLPDFVEPAVSPHCQPLFRQEFPLVLSSAKWVQYCHSQQRNNPELHKRMPDPLLEIHPETAQKRGIGEGDWIKVRSPSGEMFARARLNRHLATDVVVAQYGWWSTGAGNEGKANYSDLIDDAHCDPLSGAVGLRSGMCEVERIPSSQRSALTRSS